MYKSNQPCVQALSLIWMVSREDKNVHNTVFLFCFFMSAAAMRGVAVSVVPHIGQEGLVCSCTSQRFNATSHIRECASVHDLSQHGWHCMSPTSNIPCASWCKQGSIFQNVAVNNFFDSLVFCQEINIPLHVGVKTGLFYNEQSIHHLCYGKLKMHQGYRIIQRHKGLKNEALLINVLASVYVLQHL